MGYQYLGEGLEEASATASITEGSPRRRLARSAVKPSLLVARQPHPGLAKPATVHGFETDRGSLRGDRLVYGHHDGDEAGTRPCVIGRLKEDHSWPLEKIPASVFGWWFWKWYPLELSAGVFYRTRTKWALWSLLNSTVLNASARLSANQ